MPIAKAVQLIKGSSSRWMNETCKNQFAWQEGYGAFTIGISPRGDTIRYIQAQAEHHRKRDFQAEFVVFLKRNGIEFDPRFIWGEAADGVSGVPAGRGSIRVPYPALKRRAILGRPYGTECLAGGRLRRKDHRPKTCRLSSCQLLHLFLVYHRNTELLRLV